MTQYIDKAALVAEIQKLYDKDYHYLPSDIYGYKDEFLAIIDELEVKEINLEQPEPYFYCKYGGIIPLCSDCKRNHSNSSFKTEEIITWIVPSKGSKYCIDYVQQEQPKLDIEKIIEKTYHDRSVTDTTDMDHVSYENIARHFFELGLKAQKE